MSAATSEVVVYPHGGAHADQLLIARSDRHLVWFNSEATYRRLRGANILRAVSVVLSVVLSARCSGGNVQSRAGTY